MMNIARLVKLLKVSGCWQPIDYNGMKLQTFGYGDHICVAGVVIEHADGSLSAVIADLSKEEATFANGDIIPIVDRFAWIEGGGNPALLHELST